MDFNGVPDFNQPIKFEDESDAHYYYCGKCGKEIDDGVMINGLMRCCECAAGEDVSS
jgi:hypothetical protein